MSSSVVANFSSSSANKGHGSYTQRYDELNSDFFDQFLTFDNHTAANDHESPDYSILPTHFDDGPINGEHCGTASPGFLGDSFMDPTSVEEDTSMMIDSAASFNIDLGSYFYAELSGRAAISDPELLSLENITLDSPQIPQHPQTSPSSPRKNEGPFMLRKNRIAASITHTLKRATGSIDRTLTRSPIKKAASSKTLRTKHSNTSQEFWEHELSQEAAKFEVKMEHLDSPTLSSAKLDYTLEDLESPASIPAYTQTSSGSRSSISPETTRTPLVGFPTKLSAPQVTSNLGYDTPIATPKLEPHHTLQTTYQGTSSSPFPATPRSQNNSGTWSQMPSSGTYVAYNNANNTDLPDMDDPIWWNNTATIPIAQPSPSGYHTNPQRATKSLIAMHLQNDLAYSANDVASDPFNMSQGLMIQMPSTNSTQLSSSFNMGEVSSPIQQATYFTSPKSGPREQRERQQFIPRTRNMHSYSHPNLGVSHISGQLPPTPTLRKSRSHHPSSQAFPQYLTQRQQLHKFSPREQYAQHANLSSHSDSDSGSPCSSPSLQVRKRKSAKSIKKSADSGPVDFVNYTPNDSKRILTGVAPSGSSKTKARREKEALDKRRKLSQAAVRAVKAAGGDVESLVEQGLFC